MTDSIIQLENIVQVLSNPDLENKDMVSTQEINAVLWKIAECTLPGPVGPRSFAVPQDDNTFLEGKKRLKAIGVQVRAQLAKMRKRTYKDNTHTSVELRLAKINKDLRGII